jgi:hypothetical protein
MGYFEMHFPRKQADVVEQVDTLWYCRVTVIGSADILVACGHGVIVVRGSATAKPIAKVTAPIRERMFDDDQVEAKRL